MGNKITYDLIKDLIYNNQSIIEFVKKLHYEEMYKTIYKESYKELNNNSNYESFLETAYKIYIRQTALNISLNITEGKIDNFLIGCIIMETYRRFPDAFFLKYVDGNDFKEDLTHRIKTNYYGSNENNTNLIKSLKK